MAFDYNPVDVYLHTNHIFISRLIEDFVSGNYEYRQVEPNPAIIDFMFLHQPPERVVCKAYVDRPYKNKVFYGSVLLSTLNYYIVKDNTLEDLKFFPQFNGSRFSELSNQWKRCVKEMLVDVVVEGSFNDDESIVLAYVGSLDRYMG